MIKHGYPKGPRQITGGQHLTYIYGSLALSITANNMKFHSRDSWTFVENSEVFLFTAIQFKKAASMSRAILFHRR